MRRLLMAILLAAITLGASSHAPIESGTQFGDLRVTHTLGEQINIEAQVHSEIPIQEVWVFIQSENGTEIISDQATLNPSGEVTYTHDLAQYPLRVFTYISIWLELKLENGETVRSEPHPYFYDDNRFDWQALKTDEFQIYWHEGDAGFGQNILNAAYEGLQRIRSHVTVPQPEGVAIYVYANAMELQEILLFSGQSAAWVAGHADPDLGVIMVSLPLGPDQNLEIKRQIPHELTHVLLYQKLGTGYDSLPQWLNEGLASTAELFPNPDYQVLLDKAYERGSLIPISDLCYRFPMDAANFQLSYAESTAFTRYLQQTYGKAAMEDLIQAYADGLGCAQGTEAAVGIPLTELEADWRQAMFNENAAFNALMEFAPWMLLLMAVLAAPVGLMILGARKRVAGGE
ncbi:MAG: hypothetical protein KJ638_12040 [Chloroflexi bacterium]|nr:hypothetical protein [Chloroflexota bacterium]